MRTDIAWLLAIGCGGAAHAPSAVPASIEPLPKVRFVVANERSVQRVETSPTGLVVTGAWTLPAIVDEIEWAGEDPVVMLRSDAGDPELGRITAEGYRPFPQLPPTTWTTPPPPKGFARYDPPEWRLIVAKAAAGDEIWQGRCEWGVVGHAGTCSQWRYARLAPEPAAVVTEEPKPRGRPPLPTIAASGSIQLALVAVASDGGRRRHRPENELDRHHGPVSPLNFEPFKMLTCTSPGSARVEYPPVGERDESIRITGVTWLRTEPPLYEVTELVEGQYDKHVIFEGCTPKPGFDGAELAGGPHDMLAISLGSSISVRWKGREIGTLPGVGTVRFAP